MTRHRPADRPNIVFITTDTQGRDVISCYHDTPRPGIQTPEIDAFAARGVRFENAFTASPVCGPARTSWYSGLYPSQHHTLGNNVPARADIDWVPQRLSRAGYRCHHLGKWHVGRDHADDAIAMGFDRQSWYSKAEFMGEVGRDGSNRWGGWERGLGDEAYCYGHRVADRAIDLIEGWSPGDEPLFLAVDIDEPHGPYIAPPPFTHRFRGQDVYVAPPGMGGDLSGKPMLQQRWRDAIAEGLNDPNRLPPYYHAYYACNSYADYEVGRVLAAAERHLPAGTLIVFTSDHGDHLGAFGLGSKGPTMYDLCTAVPLIARVTGGDDVPGRVESGLVSHVDMVQTMLDAAGADAVKESGGRSLLPVLNGDGGVDCDAAFIQYHRFSQRHSQRGGFFPIRCIRTQRWKLCLNLNDLDELYDLEADPHETLNRIEDARLSDMRRDLHDRLLSEMEERRDLLAGDGWKHRPWREDADWAVTSPGPSGTLDHWRVDHLGGSREGAI